MSWRAWSWLLVTSQHLHPAQSVLSALILMYYTITYICVVHYKFQKIFGYLIWLLTIFWKKKKKDRFFFSPDK